MLRRLPGLFDRFAAQRLRASRPGPTIRGPGGEALGRVDRIAIEGRRIVVEGHARAGEATLRRGDAAAGARLPAAPGPAPFALAVPLDAGADLRLDLAGAAGTLAEARLRPPSAALARARLWLPFAWAALAALPDAMAWRRTRDPARRARVKRRLGLDLMPESGPLDPRMLTPPVAHPAPDRPVILLVPVFDAFDDLRECLDRVIRHTDLPWRLLLVEDASPDPRVRPWLRDWAEARRTEGRSVELLENPANLGFVGAVNRGLARAREVDADAPVVLLNTDAMVPEAWASRLLAPLADPSVGSVTPLSNDAEILTVPGICRRIDLAPGAGDALDRAARALDPVAAAAPMPTGVGFCMALAPGALALAPGFDPAFGRGYGEEVDWCQKVRAAGLRHLGTGGLFVEHRGGGSFGSEAKRELIARNGEIVSRRYPRYDAEVQRFLADDPLATPRLALAVAWAADLAERRPGPEGLVPLILAHTMGGGAEVALGRRIAADLARGMPSVVLRVGGRARWRLEVHAPEGAVTGGTTDDLALVRRLLAPLRRRRVVYSCGVGDPDPVTLPTLLLSLADEAEEAVVEVELHDYFPVSPSYTLLTMEDAFLGPVMPGQPGSDDPAHQALRPDGSREPLAAWQAAWGPLVARAAVTAFSEASADLLRAAYPKAAVTVRPHAMAGLPGRVDRPAGPRTLGVLGNINAHKGSALVTALARLAGGREGGVARVVLVGDLDPEAARPRALVVHGPYKPGEIADLARRHGITDWLIPSIWPETFSFTTREALATGLPTWAFAIGAQGEAVAAAPNGRPLPAVLLRDGPPDARAVRDAIEAAP